VLRFTGWQQKNKLPIWKLADLLLLKSHHYHFSSVWKVDASLEKAWNIIKHPENWTQWWKGVLKAEIISAGGENGIRKKHAFIWQSFIPYKLHFTSEVIRIQELKYIEAKVEGELEGTGTWYFSNHRNETVIRFDWKVATAKTWMNLFAPVLKPVFIWNHNWLMKQGEKGIKNVCGCSNKAL
jgi:hypothetical protein